MKLTKIPKLKFQVKDLIFFKNKNIFFIKNDIFEFIFYVNSFSKFF